MCVTSKTSHEGSFITEKLNKRRKNRPSISGNPVLDSAFFNMINGTGPAEETSRLKNKFKSETVAADGAITLNGSEGGIHAGLSEKKENAKIKDDKAQKALTGEKEISDMKKINEDERIIKRYYIRPQNIFCSNKADILKALAEIGKASCSIYSLKRLEDHDDVHKLTTSDIIYYYDNGVLSDKNHVQILDFDLYVKHEEERKHFGSGIENTTKQEFNKEYADRIVDKTVADKEAKGKKDKNEAFNPFALDFKPVNAFGETLSEDTWKPEGGVCCICGEPYEGYGNNAEPYAKGRCCDACNIKFVIPARLAAAKGDKAEDEDK